MSERVRNFEYPLTIAAMWFMTCAFLVFVAGGDVYATAVVSFITAFMVAVAIYEPRLNPLG